MFSTIIIDLVPYKWYQNTFLGEKLWVIFSTHKSKVREEYTQELQVVHKCTLLATLVTPAGTPSSGSKSNNTCIWIGLDILKLFIDKPIGRLT
jgi:hypothetical protein